MAVSEQGRELHVPVHPVRFVTAAACSTGTTPRSTSCGASCRRRAPRSSTSATTARSARSSTRRWRRTRRASRSAPTRAATSSTSSTWSSCCAEAGRRARPGLRRRRRGHRAGRDRAAGRGRGADLLPRGRPAAGPAGMINQLIRDCDTDLGGQPGPGRRRAGRRSAGPGPGDHRLQGGRMPERGPCRAGRRRGVPAGAGARASPAPAARASPR